MVGRGLKRPAAVPSGSGRCAAFVRASEQAARNAAAARKGLGKSPFEMLIAVAAPNSYHAGQAVVLRQLLGKWPPPSGGLTW